MTDSVSNDEIQPFDAEKVIRLKEKYETWKNIEDPNITRCLIIDDDPTICALLRSVFKDRGIDVLTATSAKKGLAIAKEYATFLHCILVDMRLSLDSGDLTDGRQLAKLISETDYNGNLFIITGHDHPGMVEGADKVILKYLGPVEIVELVIDGISQPPSKKHELAKCMVSSIEGPKDILATLRQDRTESKVEFAQA